ncbi:hypothetical protein IFT59_07080 [Rhizobium sp. CFBP 8752]|uniref:hypothetical protein n=1 Tax=Rhizobium sp. CFBP 8752 TaxID=2775301 RepID=UPI0017837A1B|nr:hypothetical protein [Rhizobium sp. CFBP 8752]MBD8663014.1 hypothetical protein [Rhizobium sp. CFBP 8752]
MVAVKIDGNTMQSAQKAAKRGEAIEYRDKEAPGLAIRVKSGTAYFWCVTSTFKVSIAPVGYFQPDQLDGIRALIPRLKHIKKEGGEPKHLVAEFVGGERDVEKAENKAGLRAGEWTWEAMRDAFLEHLKDTGASKSYSNNLSALGTDPNGALHDDFKTLHGMPVKSITPNELAAVTRSIIQRGKLKEKATKRTNYPQARLTHAAIQAVFAWATNPENQDASGLKLNIARLVRMPKAPKMEAKDLRPEDIVKAPLASPKLIAKFAFQWSVHDPITKDCTRAALVLQLLTGQRIATVLRSFKGQFIRTPGKPWAFVWALGPDKTGSYRALPLPEVASSIVFDQLKRARDDNRYLFPQLRKGKGRPDRDGHLSDSTTADVTDRARAVGGSLPRTFKGSHDFRRAFTSHLGDWKALGFDDKESVELVTHRNEGAESVSQAVYNLNPLLREKYKVLRTYQDLLIKAADPKFDGDYSMYALEDAFEYEQLIDQHNEEYFDDIRAEMERNYDPSADKDPDD